MAPRTPKTIWLMLTFLALRGLVPAGYMVDVSSGSLSIVICGSGIYAAAAQNVQVASGRGVDHSQHQHHSGHATPGAEDQTGTADHSICPFAVAATGASSTPPAIAVVETVGLGRLARFSTAIFSSFGPSRAQQSRAPPAFS